MSNYAFHLDDLPDEVQATIEARDRALAALGNFTGGLEFTVDVMRKWIPGSTVRVAFLGGDTELHRDIAEVTDSIGESCNLTLDFGHEPEAGTFRTWSEEDEDYQAEIRVSFDQRGYFSLVGTDSIDRNIGVDGRPVGGDPNQRSLNLGGFQVQRPATWRGTVLHEFLHALAFNHEHSNSRGPCQEDFRWEDDPNYVPTRTASGVFVTDSEGRRPGIYTFLSGAPNNWSRAKVDRNLKVVTGSGILTSEFDRASVMLYRFPALFYRTPNSDCAPSGDGQHLSEGDQRGLGALYPGAPEASDETVALKRSVLNDLQTRGAGPVAAEGGSGAVAGLAAAETSATDERVVQRSIDALSRQLSTF